MSLQALSWTLICLIALSSTCGDVLTARSMKEIGDLDEIRARAGMSGAIRAVVANPRFIIGLVCMSIAFYSVSAVVSFANVSFVIPASAALTFVANALVAQYYLKEAVTARRWASIFVICCGIYLIRQ